MASRDFVKIEHIKSEPSDDYSDEFRVLEELLSANTKVRTIGNRRSDELIKFLKKDTCESMIEQASGYEDPRIFSHLLVRYMENPRHYSAHLNALFLKRIGRLLYHSHSEYANLALAFLQIVVDEFGEKIYLHSSFDNNYQRCRNALIQVCFNSSFLMERLNRCDQQKRFNNILKQIDKITLF